MEKEGVTEAVFMALLSHVFVIQDGNAHFS